MQWTTEQLRAITEAGNRIVSAAAGAGKTAVLTERLCRLVDNGVPVESLLVLTFTRAAAAEMKGRIEARLLSAAEAAPEEQRSRLYFAANAVGCSSISTIDAFSARIVRRYGHLIALSPTFRIIDEAGSAELRAKAEDAVFSSLAKEEAPALSALYRAFGSERAALEAVHMLDGFLDAQPYPEAFLSDAVRQYDDPAYQEGLLSGAVDICRRELALLIDALFQLRLGLTPDDEKVIGILDDELSRCRGTAIQETYADYREALLAIAFNRLVFPKDFDPAEKAAIQAARDALKDCVKKQAELFSRPEQQERAALIKSGAILGALKDITLAYRAAYAEEKRRLNALDYPDLGHFALTILENEAVAAEYREKYQFIAVDEYQDTNRLNEAIVSAIARENNRFLVGDVKQSIYGFRQAEPSLFLEKLASFSGPNGDRIDLSENFRSAKEVLFAVNEVFSRIMTASTASMDYDARASLVPGAVLPRGGAELHLIERAIMESESEDAFEDLLLDVEDAEVEARLAATRIRELIGSETVCDAKSGAARPLEFRDIAVLMRSMSGALAFSRALSQAGIPCYAQSTGGYFDAIEVVLLLNYLSLIDNLHQDIPMVAVMLSPFYGFSCDDLARIRAAHRAGAFYESVLVAADSDARISDFLSSLDRWRRESLLVPVETLISNILFETGFDEIMASMLSGGARRANLEALLERARAFEETGARGLAAFLSFMASVKSNAKLGSAEFSGENVVRVMSMHKSKGLEFPVTILSGLGKRFNLDDTKKALVLHSTAGLGLKYIDPDTGCRVTTCACRAIAKRIRSEQLSEEMRILYVAMTRAKQRLILIGSARNAADLLEHADPAPSAARVVSSSTMLQWLLLSPRTHLPTELHAREEFLSGLNRRDIAPMPAEQPEKTAALASALAWAYPYEPVKPLPKKTSVSRVHGGEIAELVSFEDPAFLSEKRVSSATVGTAAHALLQRLPLKALTETEVSESIRAFVDQGLLDRDAAAKIRAAKIAELTKGALYARMAASPRVERELPFHEKLPAGRFYQDAGLQTIYLQGVIDCCFLENDAWVLVDYKTDYVPAGTAPATVAEKHRTQLTLYAEALSALTGLPVKEMDVVLLSVNVVVQL